MQTHEQRHAHTGVGVGLVETEADCDDSAPSRGTPGIAGRRQKLEEARQEPPRAFRGRAGLPANTLILDFQLPEL